MTAAASMIPELRELYARELAAIQEEFSLNADGRRAVAHRTALVDSIVQTLWKEIIVSPAGPSPDVVASASTRDEEISGSPQNFALVATGGYGRGWLFPHSDIDLLFLHADDSTEAEYKDPIRRFSQELWDLRLRLSPATHSLAECDRLDPNNLEFAISLLDCRYLAGDRELFNRLREKSIPRLVARECHALIQNLGDLTRARHHKFANTVFHLEPNVKDGPGGLRDYNVANWLALISAMEKLKMWPEPATLLPVSSRRAFDAALDFQMSVRCFLHFRHGRGDNTLSWDAQEEAAARRIGAPDSEITSAADWMRIYFGHVRGVHRVCTQLIEEIPAAWSSLYRQFQGWRSKIPSNDYSVVDGLIFLQQPSALQDPEKLLGLFHFMAEHGLKLSTTTEYKIEQALPALADHDLANFGAAIKELQIELGDYFAPAQGGARFMSPDVAAILDILDGAGAFGVGQSSWGPTGFAFAQTPDEAARLAMIAAPQARRRGLDIRVCQALNRGAQIVAHAYSTESDK